MASLSADCPVLVLSSIFSPPTLLSASPPCLEGRCPNAAFTHPHQAANPGCILEDFVRWYSPRDYVEEEVLEEHGEAVVRGDLSARMKIPGNMWAEAWQTAKPIPVRRQRRLFDDTKEAEKV